MNNIKTAKYLKNEEGTKNYAIHIVHTNGDQSTVPLSLGNRDYRNLLEKIKEGTLTIKDAD